MDGRLPDEDAPKRGLTWRWRGRVERWLEKKGWVPKYRRLVVVCGMARTGTSVLAAYVGSHPDVKVVVGGHFWHRMESDCFRDRARMDWEFVDKALDDACPGKLLVKQPWLEHNTSFFAKAEGAKVLVCTREPEALMQSWVGPGREYVDMPCKNNGGAVWVRGMCEALCLVAGGAMRVRQEGMGPELAKPLGRFLGLDQKGFDEKRVKEKWVGKTDLEWIEKRAVWRNRI